jgi:hypothetical protein
VYTDEERIREKLEVESKAEEKKEKKKWGSQSDDNF